MNSILPHSHGEGQKCLLTLPGVFWRSKVKTPIEKHCFKPYHLNFTDEEIQSQRGTEKHQPGSKGWWAGSRTWPPYHHSELPFSEKRLKQVFCDRIIDLVTDWMTGKGMKE
jgi:hypothetical protein